MKTIEQLRVEAAQIGLYAIEETPSKWMCIRKIDGCFLARSERSESMALQTGLERAKVIPVDM